MVQYKTVSTTPKYGMVCYCQHNSHVWYGTKLSAQQPCMVWYVTVSTTPIYGMVRYCQHNTHIWYGTKLSAQHPYMVWYKTVSTTPIYGTVQNCQHNTHVWYGTLLSAQHLCSILNITFVMWIAYFIPNEQHHLSLINQLMLIFCHILHDCLKYTVKIFSTYVLCFLIST